MKTHSISEVADLFTVSARTVEQWIARGELRALNVSRNVTSRKPRLRVTLADLDSFMAMRSTVTASVKPARRRPTSVPNYI